MALCNAGIASSVAPENPSVPRLAMAGVNAAPTVQRMARERTWLALVNRMLFVRIFQ